MGDTFAHGRLANPPHPMWLSFETFHVNWFPTYSSIYPPAQGAILAIGQLLGSPWIGVLLSAAAMCSAIAWMLQAWMPSRWALLGGVLAAIKFGVASYWMNSYWGGAAAAIGGALVLGALGRISKRPTAWNGVVLGLGVAILANSRPYEGMLFCIPAAAWFIWWLATARKPASAQHTAASSIRARVKVLVSVLIVLTAAAAFMGYYNWRLTGNALLMPHTLRTRTYHSSALFLWEHSRPPLHYNNQQFEDFYNGWERENYRHTWKDVWRVSQEKINRGGHTFFWWGVILLAPGVPFVLRDKKMRLLLATIFIGALGVFAVIWSFAHYAAPFTCVIVALLVQSIRHLRTMTVANFPARPLALPRRDPFAHNRNNRPIQHAISATLLPGHARETPAEPRYKTTFRTSPVNTSSSSATNRITTSTTNGSTTAPTSTPPKSCGPANSTSPRTPNFSPISKTVPFGSSNPTTTTPN